MISVVVANPLHYIIGGFYFGTLGNATAYSILPISDGGLKYFFIQKHKSQKYCNRIDETGMPCAKAVKRKLKRDRLENNPALKLYDTAYKKYHARLKNGIITQQQFNSWQYKAKEKLKQVEDGMLNISIFQEWLKK